MNQDNKMHDQQNKTGQGKDRHEQTGGQTGGQFGNPSQSRGNPSTTERIQPEGNRGGNQRPEGDKPVRDRDEPKL